MSTAREEILRRVRAAQGAPPDSTPAELPARPDKERGAVIDEFAEITADYRAVVERCSADDISARVAAALSTYDVRTVVVPPGLDAGWMRDVAAEHVPDDELTAAALDTIDAVVTAAAAAIADTGTIVLDHGADQGRRALTLVPDVHVCVVRESQVYADVPTGVRALRPAVEAGRALTWISGPSATSDIELQRVEGVHGPRTLHVIVAGD
ncbi:LutC/YkgG family protein [Luteipulveratus halotolerans]|uniref:LUD domain-containing protein n=1 Tax=Luteipulveratus halotolerans TaxID=1631356 RepID=A0A0L6CGN0_9MICO|nr:LUD domain-containing protein [Luteipulveratus halotolerans]KNX36760.1 hypothetical protein VV01_05740 [Luteipulveratus halotolerans]